MRGGASRVVLADRRIAPEIQDLLRADEALLRWFSAGIRSALLHAAELPKVGIEKCCHVFPFNMRAVSENRGPEDEHLDARL